MAIRYWTISGSKQIGISSTTAGTFRILTITKSLFAIFRIFGCIVAIAIAIATASTQKIVIIVVIFVAVWIAVAVETIKHPAIVRAEDRNEFLFAFYFDWF